MKSVTVGQLRQNPTEMLDDVEAGETYRITRHNREIGRIVPSSGESLLVSAKRTGAARTRNLPKVPLQTATSIDELIDDTKGAW